MRILRPRPKRRWAASSARSRCSRRDRPFRSAFTMPPRLRRQRLALVGDAAHAIHPIAGQGLNLGFRDAAALAQVLVEGARLGLDLGDRQLLDRYQRWRGARHLLVSLATDSLTRIYGVPGKTASASAGFGMGLINRIAPLKDRLTAKRAAPAASCRFCCAACRSDYCSVWPTSAPPVASTLELHQLDDQVGASSERRFLEQRLFRAGVEWRDLGDGVDQHFVVERPDRVPVDRQAQRIAEAARLALDFRPLEKRQRLWLLIVERLDVDLGVAIGRVRGRVLRPAGSGSIRAGRC